ncbi:MAG: BMP family protein [Oscillospiraceae bacterium]
MKRFLALTLSLVLALVLVACGGSASSGAPASGTGSTAPSASAPEGGYEIAMITDVGDIDDQSFNQGTWEGVKAYGEANGKTYQYYKPVEQSNDAYLNSIDQAVQNGATVVVTPGYLFAVPVGTAQYKYPDVTFILIDASPAKMEGDAEVADIATNSVGVTYAEEQAGYLAGYAAVKDGYTKLGFMGGMAVPAVVRYGFGFVQGANDAAADMNVKIDMKYAYVGSFNPSPEIQAQAASWYQEGTEVIFACGGGIGFSVFAAAESSDSKVIGVDVDQSSQSETIITSAMKSLAESVGQMLTAHYDGSFPGGEAITLGAAENDVGLPMSTSKFTTFTQADYDTLFASMADGSLTIQKDVDASGANITEPAQMGLALDATNLQFVTQ